MSIQLTIYDTPAHGTLDNVVIIGNICLRDWILEDTLPVCTVRELLGIRHGSGIMRLPSNPLKRKSHRGFVSEQEDIENFLNCMDALELLVLSILAQGSNLPHAVEILSQALQVLRRGNLSAHSSPVCSLPNIPPA